MLSKKEWLEIGERINHKYPGLTDDLNSRLRDIHAANQDGEYSMEYELMQEVISDLLQFIKTLRKETLREARLATCQFCRGESEPYITEPQMARGEWWHHLKKRISRLPRKCYASAILDLENKDE